jgi:hypothetical protein
MSTTAPLSPKGNNSAELGCGIHDKGAPYPPERFHGANLGKNFLQVVLRNIIRNVPDCERE